MTESLNTKHRDTLVIAERALGAALTATEKLSSDSKLVLRCNAIASGLPRSLIVRQLLPNDGEQQAQRQAWFFNEWAGLEFLTEIDSDCAPRIYASDVQHHLMVLEDLGDRPSLMDTLQKGEAEEAAIGLQRFLTLLGQLHTATYGRENLLLEKRLAIRAPELPLDDAKTDLRDLQKAFAHNLTRLGLTAPGAFADEIAEVSASIHDDPTFRAYTHSDAGPHNVQRGEPYRLFDFEFAYFRSGMLDAAGPRMGFPSAYHSRPSPPDVVRQAEDAYRQSIIKTIPAARDYRLFKHALLCGCAHWTFQKMSIGLDQWLKDHASGEPPPIPEDLAHFSRQNLTRLHAFAAACEEFDGLPALREVALALTERHLAASPNLEPFPLFDAFK